MHTQTFSWDHIFAQHQTLSFFIQANGRASTTDRMNNTANDFTNLLFKIVKLDFSFSFADTLLNDLACCLSSHTPKILRRGLYNNHIS